MSTWEAKRRTQNCCPYSASNCKGFKEYHKRTPNDAIFSLIFTLRISFVFKFSSGGRKTFCDAKGRGRGWQQQSEGPGPVFGVSIRHLITL